ncbi:hypothetical protein ACFC96_12665 [Streptomyces sp. NPDC055955]|uniref:hypothetical protein n=1 Tax=Streptomyces sp. NPDC055955 TaxID=3345665 RepID=UPI0035DCC0CC
MTLPNLATTITPHGSILGIYTDAWQARIGDSHMAALAGANAAGAAGRVERALDIAAHTRTLAQRCACGGEIDMHGGEGRPPVAHCAGCGRIWTEAGVVAA